MTDDSINRRTVLAGLSAVGTASLAGCSVSQEGNDGGDGGNESGGGDGGSGEQRDGAVTLDSVHVVAADNQTGPFNYLFTSANKMTQIALDEIEAAGGPLGADLNFDFQDTAVNPANWKEVMTKGVFSDNAAFIYGSATNEIAAHKDWIVENEIPVVTGWPGGLDLRQYGGDRDQPDDLSQHDWVWRTIVGDSLTQLGAAQWAVEEKDWTRFGVFHGASSDQAVTADAFIDAIESKGGSVAQEIQFQEGKTNYGSEFDRMPWDDIDAVWIMTTVDTGIGFMRQWGNSEYSEKPAVLQEWARPQSFIDETKQVLQGKEIYTMAGTPATDDPLYQEGKSKFEERYPDSDWYPQFTLPPYDAAIVASLALHRAGTLGDLPADPSIEEIRRGIERNTGPIGRPPGTEVTSFADGKEALDDGEDINFQGYYSTCDFTEFGNVLVDVNMFKYPTADQESYQQVATVPPEDLSSLTDGNY